jgi:hypothetical protein
MVRQCKIEVIDGAGTSLKRTRLKGASEMMYETVLVAELMTTLHLISCQRK